MLTQTFPFQHFLAQNQTLCRFHSEAFPKERKMDEEIATSVNGKQVAVTHTHTHTHTHTILVAGLRPDGPEIRYQHQPRGYTFVARCWVDTAAEI